MVPRELSSRPLYNQQETFQTTWRLIMSQIEPSTHVLVLIDKPGLESAVENRSGNTGQKTSAHQNEEVVEMLKSTDM